MGGGPEPSWEASRVGVDIGGTFTDAVAVSQTGVRTAKVPSRPDDPAAAVAAAVDALHLEQAPERFLHGTTLVTNLLLERGGAPTGFLTSRGVRDVLHLGRHERPLNYAIRQEIPRQHHPPVPRRWRRALAERVDADGSVVCPLDETEVREAAQALKAEGVEAIAIGFLHAYRHPEHERQAVAWVRDEVPEVFACASHEVSARFREYERFMTTAWNARITPRATRYLERLAADVSARWPGVDLTLMTSNGGTEPAATVARSPIRLALSGPAAAGNAVRHLACVLGLGDTVGLDVGGTSADIVVVRGGRLREAPHEDRRVAGYPLQIPMLDLQTIGAGGGSIVARDSFGLLHVGPQSAGASPGPACYGRGGTSATVTDAAVAVGRLPAEVRLGGTLALDLGAAEAALDGVDPLDVLALTEARIAFAIRERTVARGMDPGELALVAAGGAGPLLACGVAEVLGLSEVVVPPHPGLLAAWGLLTAPERRESVVTVLMPLASVGEPTGFAAEARARLPGPPPPGIPLRWSAGLRYLGQGFEVEVEVSDPHDVADLAARFHEAHAAEYGFALPEAPVEWVELRAAWEVPATPWQFPEPVAPRREDGRVRLRERTGEVEASLVNRDTLRPGDVVEGPAVVVDPDATAYLASGWQARVDVGGALRVTRC